MNTKTTTAKNTDTKGTDAKGHDAKVQAGAPAITDTKGTDAKDAKAVEAKGNSTEVPAGAPPANAGDAKGTPDKAPEPTAAQVAEAAAAKALAERQAVFDALPTLTIGEAQGIRDMSALETSPLRKYEKVHTDALQDKLPVLRGWAHTTAMFVPGHNKGGENGFKAGSVYGTIQQIVQAAGKAGIAAYEVAGELRRRQIGNKRSHYCVSLPPVGWAEGWLRTSISKGIINVHATKKADALVIPTAAKDTEATPEQNAKAIAKAA